MGKVESTETLDRLGIVLNERLGQHVLVDNKTLNLLGGQVTPGGSVLEVGVGTGNITAVLAERARRVVGIEIDRRFDPIIGRLETKFPNVNVSYGDVLAMDLQKLFGIKKHDEEWQIVSNLPFHISEPFLKKVVDLPVRNVVLIIGDVLARSLQIDDPNSGEFSRISLLSQTFFDTIVLANIDKASFYPPPRTNAIAVVLTPKEREEFQSNPRLAIQRHLFLTEHKSPTVGKAIKVIRDNFLNGEQGISHKTSRRQSKQELRQLLTIVNNGELNHASRPERGIGSRDDTLGLPEKILSTPFLRLNNQEVRSLAKALRGKFGQ